MDKLMEWWYGHEPREQMILGGAGVALVLFLFYFFAISPVQEWHQREQQRLQQTRDDVVEVQELVAKIKARRQSGAGQSQGNQNLAVVIDNSLRENELVMRGFTPGANNDARLRLENAAYTALMQWLHDLEYRHGVHIEDLSLTPASAPGYLMVSLRVSQ